jgi:hypothetical protein
MMKAYKTNRAVGLMAAMLSFAVVFAPIAEVGAALNVPISRSVTVSAVVTGTNILNVAIKNVSNDVAASQVAFPSSSGIATAQQYLEIEYDSIAVGARVVIRTDNATSSPAFSGTGEGAGLVGNTDTTRTAPLLWVVFDTLAPIKTFTFQGDTDPSSTVKGTVPGATERGAGESEGLVVDKANPNYETTDIQGYATVVVPTGTAGLLGSFPTDADGSGPGTGLRTATSPIFLLLGGGFSSIPAQTYSTTKLALDLVVQ